MQTFLRSISARVCACVCVRVCMCACVRVRACARVRVCALQDDQLNQVLNYRLCALTTDFIGLKHANLHAVIIFCPSPVSLELNIIMPLNKHGFFTVSEYSPRLIRLSRISSRVRQVLTNFQFFSSFFLFLSFFSVNKNYSNSTFC